MTALNSNNRLRNGCDGWVMHSIVCILYPEFVMNWLIDYKAQTSNSYYRAHSVYGLIQWEATSHCNVISHLMSPYPVKSLHRAPESQWYGCVIRCTVMSITGSMNNITVINWSIHATSEARYISYTWCQRRMYAKFCCFKLSSSF